MMRSAIFLRRGALTVRSQYRLSSTESLQVNIYFAHYKLLSEFQLVSLFILLNVVIIVLNV